MSVGRLTPLFLGAQQLHSCPDKNDERTSEQQPGKCQPNSSFQPNKASNTHFNTPWSLFSASERFQLGWQWKQRNSVWSCFLPLLWEHQGRPPRSCPSMLPSCSSTGSVWTASALRESTRWKPWRQGEKDYSAWFLLHGASCLRSSARPLPKFDSDHYVHQRIKFGFFDLQ